MKTPSDRPHAFPGSGTTPEAPTGREEQDPAPLRRSSDDDEGPETADPALFGNPGPVIPGLRRYEGLSRDAARTAHQLDLIAAGVNPATRFPLHDGVILIEVESHRVVGPTCGTCAHLDSYGRGGYLKCDLVSLSHSAATDVRRWWPGCSSYDPRPDPT